jgi:hypothetical protein
LIAADAANCIDNDRRPIRASKSAISPREPLWKVPREHVLPFSCLSRPTGPPAHPRRGGNPDSDGQYRFAKTNPTRCLHAALRLSNSKLAAGTASDSLLATSLPGARRGARNPPTRQPTTCDPPPRRRPIDLLRQKLKGFWMKLRG